MKTKQPFAIGLGNHGPMSLAGLWEEWTPKDALPLLSVSMLTCSPNTLMEPIHNRMPVIVGDEDLGKWLGEESATDQEVRGILKPFNPDRMIAWKVSNNVGKVQNQGSELIDAI